MTATDLSPIPLLPHEASHAATHDTGLLWRAIEPQPEDVGRFEPDGAYWRPIIVSSSRSGSYPSVRSDFFAGDCYYVQEEWDTDREHDRNAVRSEADDDGSVPFLLDGAGGFGGGVAGWRPEWRPASTMPPEFARTIIEITRVGVHQAFTVGFHQECPPETWGFLYHYIVKERRA